MSREHLGINTGRAIETGAVLGALTGLLAVTGLLLSPTIRSLLDVTGLIAPWDNALYVVHVTSGVMLVAFVLWHLLPFRHAFSRKANASTFDQFASYLLFALITVEVLTGYVLLFRDYTFLGKRDAVLVHLATTFLILAPFTVHLWRGVETWVARHGARDAAYRKAIAAKGELLGSATRPGISRRTFLRLAAYSIAGVAIAGLVGRMTVDTLSSWRLNYVGETPELTKENWRLRITGLVEGPVELAYEDILALPARTLSFTHHCVEGWSYSDTFTGVPLKKVLARAGAVKPGASQLVFKSAETSTRYYSRGQRYTTNFPYEDGLHDDVLLVFQVAGLDLPRIHGGPVRLMSPGKWGYKACKWLTEIEVSADPAYRGYWEQYGYHNDGDYPGPIFDTRA